MSSSEIFNPALLKLSHNNNTYPPLYTHRSLLQVKKCTVTVLQSLDAAYTLADDKQLMVLISLDLLVAL